MEDGIWIVRDRVTKELTLCKVETCTYIKCWDRQFVQYPGTDED
jgi:hypothetical protein